MVAVEKEEEHSNNNNENQEQQQQHQQFRLLVCSGNLGHAQPDETSLEAWIPKDGRVEDVVGEEKEEQGVKTSLLFGRRRQRGQRYPVIFNQNVKSSSSSSPPSPSPPPPSSQKSFDIIVIGMQESTFEPKSPKSSNNNNNSNRGSGRDATSASSPPTKMTPKASSSTTNNNNNNNNTIDDSISSGTGPDDILKSAVEDVLKPAEKAVIKTLIGAEKVVKKTVTKTMIGINQVTASADRAVTTTTTPTTTPNNNHNHQHPSSSARLPPQQQQQQPNNEKKDPADDDDDEPTIIANMTSPIAQMIAADWKLPSKVADIPTNPADWTGGTAILHRLLEARLPSYSRIVSYQRGEMRLEVFVRRRQKQQQQQPLPSEETFSSHQTDEDENECLDVQVLNVKAQNTGLVGGLLANKGGIMADLLVEKHTRVSFVTAHLDAHEGPTKYQARCQSLSDILAGTRDNIGDGSGKDGDSGGGGDPNHPAPNHTNRKRHHYPQDVSVTSHYCFVLGDLNFRCQLPVNYSSNHKNNNNKTAALAGNNNGTRSIGRGSAKKSDTEEAAHRAAVRNLVLAKDWTAVNAADELGRALSQKDCLVGFRTPLCNFPPTFKLERKPGYHYIEKRTPSYTDRILWKTGHKLEAGVRCEAYEPVDQFASSDHKPVRAAFSVELNAPFRFRPLDASSQKLRTRRFGGASLIRRNASSDDDDSSGGGGFSLAKLFQPPRSSIAKDPSAVDLSAGSKMSRRFRVREWEFDRPAEIHLFVSKVHVTIRAKEKASAPRLSPAGIDTAATPPNPYVTLVSYPEAAIRFQESKWTKVKRKLLRNDSSNLLSYPKTQDSAWKKFKRQWVRRKSLVYFIDDTGARKRITKAGWPRSSYQKNTWDARWETNDDDFRWANTIVRHERKNKGDINCEIKTHLSDGSAVDLTGAILYFTVMNYHGTRSSSLLGTFAFNLVDLLCKVSPSPIDKSSPQQEQGRGRRKQGCAPSLLSASTEQRRMKKFFASSPSRRNIGQLFRSNSSPGGNHSSKDLDEDDDDENDDDLRITGMDIDEPLVKNGREIGRLRCHIEAWWMDVHEATKTIRKPRAEVASLRSLSSDYSTNQQGIRKPRAAEISLGSLSSDDSTKQK